jgi:peptide/nickel transport system ATP-binding protein
LVKAVDGISFTVDPGQTLGVVGESGSGKSVTFLAVMGLLDRNYTQISGEVLFRGEDLLTVSAEELRATRGDRMSMIFQDPLTALNPVHRVGAQIAEVFLAHDKFGKKEAWAAAVTLLERVGISQPSQRARQYPHEFSGGMRQRAMIAMALALNPDLLIADEPTTALDVTVQAQILDLLDRLKDEFNASVVIITHDLGVVAEHCDDIMVMYGGRAVEKGNRNDIYHESQHPYTWGLLGSIARLDAVEARLRPIDGQPPSLINIPQGCAFHPRCPHVMDICRTEVPELIPSDGHHESACHLSLGEKQRIFSEQVAQRA